MLKVLLIDLNDYDEEDHGMSAGPGNLQVGTLEVMSNVPVGDSLNSGNTATTDDRVRIIDQATYRSAKSDWRRIGVVVDRFFFAVFAIILIVTCLAFSGYL